VLNMDRLNNGLYISIGGTLTVMGLYAGYRQRKERRQRGGDLAALPAVGFGYIAPMFNRNQTSGP